MNILSDLIQFTLKHGPYELNTCQVEKLSVKGGVLEYCKLGKGSPLILIMGYAATLNGWSIKFLHELSKHHQVIVFNNRNTGGSLFTEAKYSIYDLAMDVRNLILGLNLNKVAVGGISMGGMVAQVYATLFPEDLTNLVLINTFPPGQLVVAPSLEVIQTLQQVKGLNVINYWHLLKLLFPSTWDLPLLSLQYFRPQGGKKLIPLATLKQQQELAKKWVEELSTKQFLGSILTPTLILCGKADAIVPPENSQIINQFIPQSRLITYPKGGHIMIYQYPIQLALQISQFLNK